jgi:isopentenyldiphosphate isomerase
MESGALTDEESVLQRVRMLGTTLPRFPDGRIDYSDSDVAPILTVFLRYGGEILLLKRSDKVSTYQGMWNTVAGYIDEDRPLRDKVLEELGEEVGLGEDDLSQITLGEPYEFTDAEIGRTWIIQPVLAELKEKPEIELDFEHTEYLWVRPGELSEYDVVPNFEGSLAKAIPQ